jgi:hypothetical protein
MVNGFVFRVVSLFPLMRSSSSSGCVRGLVSSIYNLFEDVSLNSLTIDDGAIVYDLQGDWFVIARPEESTEEPKSSIETIRGPSMTHYANMYWARRTVDAIFSAAHSNDQRRVRLLLNIRGRDISEYIDSVAHGMERFEFTGEDLHTITQEAITAYDVEKALDDFRQENHIHGRLIDVCNALRLLSSHDEPSSHNIREKFTVVANRLKKDEYNGPIVF